MIRITKKSWLWTTLAVVLLGGIAAGGYYCLLHQVKTIIAEAETLYLNGNYGQAFDAYRKIPTWQIALLSPLEQADLDINCGNCLYEMRKYADAIPFFARAAKQVEECNLLNKIEAPAQLYNRWGEGLEEKKDYKSAQSTYIHGIHVLEAVLGMSYPGIALLNSRLGGVYMQLEDYGRALVCLNLVLENKDFISNQNAYGKSLIYWKIGAAYCHNNRLSEAMTAYKKCLNYAEKSYGLTSPQSAIFFSGLALVYYNQGNSDEAIRWLDKAYTIFYEKCGKESSATQRIAKLRQEWNNNNINNNNYRGRP